MYNDLIVEHSTTCQYLNLADYAIHLSKTDTIPT